MVALAYFERGNELGFCVNRAERPNIAFGRIVFGHDVFLFLTDESPYFIELQEVALQIAHLGV